jgi:hypothetical protein
MTIQADLFERAAECERLMNLAADSRKQLALRLARDMWIALGNASVNMSHEILSKEIAVLEAIQAKAEKDTLQ